MQHGASVAFSASCSSQVFPARQYQTLPCLCSIETTLEGDPSRGSIYHLAHMHRVNHGSDLFSLEQAGQRNVAVIRELRSLDVRACFLEGFPLEDQLGWAAEQRSQHLASLEGLFPGGELPLCPNSLQSQALSGSSIPLWTVIEHFIPTLTMYGTEPLCEQRELESYLSPDATSRGQFVFAHRQQAALSSICAHMETMDPGDRRVALIYGAQHVFSMTDLPSGYVHTQAPRIYKYSFEPWSTYSWTESFMEGGSAAVQIELSEKAQRIFSYAWVAAHSGEVQAHILGKLESGIDFYSSPEDLLNVLRSQIVPDEWFDGVEHELIRMHQAGEGPFADLCLRTGGDLAIIEARGAYPSLAVWGELHPYTQREMIRVADKLDAFCYCRILSATGQLEALSKLVPHGDETLAGMANYLLLASASDQVRQEILRRYSSLEAPFSRWQKLQEPIAA